MKFTLESSRKLTVRRVSDDSIQIGDRAYTSPVSIDAGGAINDWTQGDIELLTWDDFERLLDQGADIVVLGTGSFQRIPDRQLTFSMARKGIGLEVMDTRAAARTYNVLINEERSVAAVFYL